MKRLRLRNWVKTTMCCIVIFMVFMAGVNYMADKAERIDNGTYKIVEGR